MKLYKNLSSALKERKEVLALKLTINEKFPEEIFDLPYLKELYLEGDCHEFPEIQSGLQHLNVLSLKLPNFRYDLSAVFKVPSLQNLKIIETPIKSLILPLSHTPSQLTSLTIKDCGLLSLPEEISHLWQLSELNLSGNRLTSLPVSIIDLKFLKRLNLDSNKFEIFPDILKKVVSLKHLSIDQNLFSEEEKARIQREFHIWPN